MPPRRPCVRCGSTLLFVEDQSFAWGKVSQVIQQSERDIGNFRGGFRLMLEMLRENVSPVGGNMNSEIFVSIHPFQRLAMENKVWQGFGSHSQSP